MKARLEALPGENGQAMKSLVFKPRGNLPQRAQRGSRPDCSFWRVCTGGRLELSGHAKLHVQENDTGPDGCNHAQYGMFILTAPNCPLSGEYEGARLLDIAPTLLDLAGYEIPETMQGRSLVSGMEKKGPGGGRDEESERIVHDRLAGLGYV